MEIFLGIGAQRTATTWLFECLRSHPEIYMPEEKELQYFSTVVPDNNANQSLEWYLGKLTGPGGTKIAGEITPEYLLDPESPRRIKAALSNPKLIVSLREPVERAMSAYRKGLRENDWDCSLEEFFEKNLDFCVDRGMYFQQLNRYRDYFPDQDMCVKLYDDILIDAEGFLQSIYTFLGVDPDFSSPMLDMKFNIGIEKQTSGVRFVVFFRDLIYQVLGSKGRSWIIKALQRTKLGNIWMQRLLDAGRSASVDGEYKDRYKEIFREDVRQTSQWLGRDLMSLWGYDSRGE